MKVLALASYPVEAAATRYRLHQFIAPLAERGITLTVHPFIDSRLFASLYRRQEWPRTVGGLLRSAVRRLKDVREARGADVLLVQREAMMVGPPLIEWLITKIGRCPMVLDLDDATYVRYLSPTYGRLGSAVKWFGKTDDLIGWAKIVTCGNRSIAAYVAGKGVRAVIIPTVVDTDIFHPRPAAPPADVPLLGWIGTHSTYPYLESIFPALQQLARSHRFRLRVVGSGRENINVQGVEVENPAWNLAREVHDFQSLDIGLYPIVADDWATGKSGFKAIQYMSVGVPFVVTPVGECAEIGLAGSTHLAATSRDEWAESLGRLLSDAALRESMGAAGRRYALEHYTVAAQADKLSDALHAALRA
jgi:glycosyltransferase involved in cell wall biosynthesis